MDAMGQGEGDLKGRYLRGGHLKYPRKIADFDPPLSAVEQEFVEKTVAGEPCVLGEDRPEEATAENTARAEVIRYMALGGCEAHPTHQKGITLVGAYVEGVLDLEYGKVKIGLVLKECHFNSLIKARGLEISSIDMTGSTIQHLDLIEARIASSLLMIRLKLEETSRFGINLKRAQVFGNVDFTGAELINKNGHAINAERCRVGGSVYIRKGGSKGGKRLFEATGMINFAGAKIDGQLSCIDGVFNHGLENSTENSGKVPYALNCTRLETGSTVFLRDCKTVGEVRLLGAKIGGRLDCRRSKFDSAGSSFTYGETAVNVKDAILGNRLIWTNLVGGSGKVIFENLSATALNDDAESYGFHRFEFDGLAYKKILGSLIPLDERISILDRNSPSLQPFQPHPFQQLAKVYGEMGHRRDRGAVLIEMETRLRKWQGDTMAKDARDALDGSVGAAFASIWPDVKTNWHRISSFAAHRVVGYGHRPAYSLLWALGFILFGWLGAHLVWEAGDFAPTAAPVLVSDEWKNLSRPIEEGGVPNPAAVWSWSEEAGQAPWGRDYTTFNALYYSTDLFVPLVDFGQDADWSPSTSRSWLGVVAHWLEPLIRSAGWLITAMGAAAITGVIRND